METKYKAELLLTFPDTCKSCGKENTKKEWKAMRTQDKDYTFDSKGEALKAIGIGYGILGWQDITDVEIGKVYNSVDSYGRGISIRIVEIK